MLFFFFFFYNSTPSDKEDVKKMAVDAMFKLEHGVEDKQKSKEALPTLEQLKVYHVLAFFYWYNLSAGTISIAWKSRVWKDLVLIHVLVFVIMFVSGCCRISSFSATPLYPVSFLKQVRQGRGAGSCPNQQLVNEPRCYIVTYMYIIIAEPCVHLVCLAFSHNYPLLEFL